MCSTNRVRDRDQHTSIFLFCFTAIRNGGRYIYLWLTTVLHGVIVETVSYNLPDIDNFWHAQSMVMLLGKRLPLHMMLICKYISGSAQHRPIHIYCMHGVIIGIYANRNVNRLSIETMNIY